MYQMQWSFINIGICFLGCSQESDQNKEVPFQLCNFFLIHINDCRQLKLSRKFIILMHWYILFWHNRLFFISQTSKQIQCYKNISPKELVYWLLTKRKDLSWSIDGIIQHWLLIMCFARVYCLFKLTFFTPL